MYGQLPNFAQQFLKECEGLSMDAVANLIEKFILKILENSPYKIPVTVKHWDGEFNERDERNETHKICEDMGADYIMSVDTDEFPEDRIDRNLFRRFHFCSHAHRKWAHLFYSGQETVINRKTSGRRKPFFFQGLSYSFASDSRRMAAVASLTQPSTTFL